MQEKWEAQITELPPGDGFAYRVTLLRNGRRMGEPTYADTRLGARWMAWRLKRAWKRRGDRKAKTWVSKV